MICVFCTCSPGGICMNDLRDLHMFHQIDEVCIASLPGYDLYDLPDLHMVAWWDIYDLRDLDNICPERYV